MQFSEEIEAVLSLPFFKWGVVGHPYKISYKFIDQASELATKPEPFNTTQIILETVFTFPRQLKTIIKEKFNEWSKIAGIEFSETSGSDYNIFLAYGQSRGFNIESSLVVNARVSLDLEQKPYAILFNKRQFDYFSPQQIGYIAAHEIGHVIGLGHPYTNLKELLPETKSNQNYTIMARFSNFYEITTYPATPALLDIEAAQALYGKPNKNFSTIYSSKDIKRGVSTIYSDGSLKTIDLSDINYNIVLDLNTGYSHPSFIGSESGIYLYHTEHIYTAAAGKGNDILISNGSSTLIGGAGRDIFQFSAKLCGISSIRDFQIREDKLKITDSYNKNLMQSYENNELTVTITNCLIIKLSGINILNPSDYEFA